MTDKQKDILNTKSKQLTSTTHLLHGRQAKRHLEHKIRAINQHHSLPAWQTSRKIFRIQNQSNESAQLTCCMADKQKDSQNTKSEQLSIITYNLHGKQAKKISEHEIRAINQGNSHLCMANKQTDI